MGNSIPAPAFGNCMTAVLACKLGNSYGISWDAQTYLDEILQTVSKDRWSYYLSSVLPYDRVILYKLWGDITADRWIELVEKYGLDKVEIEGDKELKDLILFSNPKQKIQLRRGVNRVLERLKN